ncbi:oxidoreductase [Paenibacillus sp. MY03]|jgi:myo-inositol 2-dehydrogenase/D-chiro-inositol 1-dehydrogenase|uniref:Gfo/Idh/MocA family protein n=1 Tax=Paenibacillus sp. MY03 TaxID=302980 RepID=UPI000B3C2B0E|nr:Gfo/Idh/MocA family oxidoreductase [Paenibacillus sp. MY03]OUS68076.1 oxidoreductase [Paenibacillus sp. MY03]
MTLQIGIIGTGWFGRMHAEKLAKLEGVNVAAFAATSQQKADEAAGKFHDAKGFAEVSDMLDARKLDAVYICVPPFAHGDIEQQLIERGIPFLVEKPIGVDEEVPGSILQGIKDKSLITSVGYHFRYMDGTARAKELLAERTIGMALGYWMGGMPGVYWWRSMEGSGGQFVEQTTHIVDLLRYTAGEVKEVYAAYGDRIVAGTEEGVTVPDVGTVTLKLASGAVATISNTCAIPAGGHNGLHLYTHTGVMEIGGNGFIDKVSGQVTEYQNRSNPYESENDAFLHAVRTGDTSRILSTYEDAWLTHRVTMAANRSARTGLPVVIE